MEEENLVDHVEYHENGTPSLSGAFRNGKLHGEVTTFSEAGVIEMKVEYVDLNY